MRQILFALTILAAGCGGSKETAGGILWQMPSGWKPAAYRPMRAATYKVPAVRGDKEDAECAVYFFGPGQGGSVQANLDRWTGQFDPPDGQDPAENAKISRQKIHGLAVTTLDVSGTYTGAGGPMAETKVRKPNYRLLGAIVEGPQGPVFFKLTGPEKTISAAGRQFQSMLRSVRK